VTEWKRYLQNKNLRAFDGDAGERSTSPGTGVDVHSVPSDIGMSDRCVAVNNIFSVIPRRVEELATYPEQVVEMLLLDGDAWTDPCVHEHEIAAAETVAQALQEHFVRTREGGPKAVMQVNFGFCPGA
jgi:hypothetical protein